MSEPPPSQDVACVFCPPQPPALLFQDERVWLFRPTLDAHAVQNFHILVVPKRHIDHVGALTPDDQHLLRHMREVALFGVLHFSSHPSSFAIMGFHQPFAITVSHLHLHVMQAPFSSCARQRAYLESNAFLSLDMAVWQLQELGQIDAGVQPDALFKRLQQRRDEPPD